MIDNHSVIKLNRRVIKMAKQTAQSKLSKYIDVPFWNEKGKLEEGDAITGYYIDKEDYTTKFGETSSYIIETKDGLFKLSGQADIRGKFASVPMGAKVWVTYTGLTETARGAKKTYLVEFDDEDIKAID